MKDVRLICPAQAYLPSYLDACREIKERNLDVPYAFRDPDRAKVWMPTLLDDLKNMALGVDLPEGYVPATTLWLVQGEEFIAAGSLRHRLTPALEGYGGHIGYAVRPTRWNQGYGTRLLGLMLEKARAMGIDPVLLTCSDENLASARVMEKNGGILRDVIETEIDGKRRLTRRYWIPTH